MKKGWEIKKLGEVCEIQGGSTPKRTESLYWEGGTYPWFTIEDVREQGRIITDTKQKVTKVAWDKLRVFPKDTVLLCCTASIGEYAITHIPLTSNQQFNGLMIKDKSYLNPMYLMHYCATLKDKLAMLSGKATIDFVSAEKVRQITIPIPPIEEQERIVEELDCLSGIIERKREQLRELDALAESIFYQMFGSVDGNHNNFEVKSLSEVFSIIKDGTHQTPQYTDDKENGIKFLSAKDVVSGTINWDNIKYIPKGLHLELHKRVAPQRNDILLCKNGTYGICALNETDEVFDIYVSLALLRPNNICIPKYLVSAINNKCTKLQFDKSIKGIGVPNLHLSEIKRTNIIVPPLTLQQEFADKIEAIEKQKELIKQSITQTEELFNARMDYYFS